MGAGGGDVRRVMTSVSVCLGVCLFVRGSGWLDVGRGLRSHGEAEGEERAETRPDPDPGPGSGPGPAAARIPEQVRARQRTGGRMGRP